MRYLCFILSIICFSYTAPAADLDQALIEAAKNGQRARVYALLQQGAELSSRANHP